MTEQAQIYRKHFIPLESNPEIFTELSHKLGLHEQLEFPDVLSLDDPDLVNFLPRPVYVLALVFPTTEAYEKRVKEEDDVADGKHVWAQANDNIDFFKQTINNACGLYAIVNAVCNGEARHWLTNDSTLQNIKDNALHANVNDVAQMIENNDSLDQAYAEVAQKGNTQAPLDAEEEVDYHYICFVKSHKNGHLYQLDGDRPRPIDLGRMGGNNSDVLSDQCLDIIRGMIASENANMIFSLMALVNKHGTAKSSTKHQA